MLVTSSSVKFMGGYVYSSARPSVSTMIQKIIEER